MAKRFWYTILYYLVLTEAISLHALARWLRRTNCQRTMMKICYSYYVIESKRLLQELM